MIMPSVGQELTQAPTQLLVKCFAWYCGSVNQVSTTTTSQQQPELNGLTNEIVNGTFNDPCTGSPTTTPKTTSNSQASAAPMTQLLIAIYVLVEKILVWFNGNDNWTCD